jgi:hypothetical protein
MVLRKDLPCFGGRKEVARMANSKAYNNNAFGMTKAPNPPKNQPKSTVVKGNDLRTGKGDKRSKG